MTKTFALEFVDGHLEDVLREVEAGNRAELTRSGEPIAVILSSREYHQLASSHHTFREALDRFLTSGAEPIEPLEDSVLEGLRDPGTGREAAPHGEASPLRAGENSQRGLRFNGSGSRRVTLALHPRDGGWR